MKKILFSSVVCFIIFGRPCIAQTCGAGLTQIELHPSLNKPVQLSSLAVHNDSFFTVKEKCGIVVSMPVSAPQNKVEVKPGFNDAAQIEGLTVYKDHLLMTDEGNRCVWDYNLKSRTLIPIDTAGMGIYGDGGDYGDEGIAHKEGEIYH